MNVAWTVLLILVIVVAAAITSLRVLREYERGVSFRLGRLRPLAGPGPVFLLPFIDRLIRVDLRTVTLTIPPQEVITRDNVPARVNAVAYFRVVKPELAITEVEASLSNVARHAHAKWARVSCVPGDEVVVCVQDDEVGTDLPDAQRSGEPGLTRPDLRGSFEVSPSQAGGTTVVWQYR
jgi:hypothetical protein